MLDLNYALPDFTAGLKMNLSLIESWRNDPAMFRDGVRFDSVYDCFPQCKANGGRHHLGKPYTPFWMHVTLAALNNVGVKARLTFTNMFIDGNVINPRLLSNAVEVHPLVVVVALIAGSAVGGLAGMLIAVPLAAFIKVQLERWLTKREEALYGSTRSLDKSLEPKDDLDEPLVPESRDEMLSRVPEMTE